MLTVILFSACEDKDSYGKYTETIDSLYEDVSGAADLLRQSDSAELGIMMEQYRSYRRFIELNFYDTLSGPQAETLRQFEEGGKKMEVFFRNRALLLKRADLHKEQLVKLGAGAAKGTIEREGLGTILKNERDQVTTFVEFVKNELNDLDISARQFRTSLPEVQEMIRKKNDGQLPTVIKSAGNR